MASSARLTKDALASSYHASTGCRRFADARGSASSAAFARCDSRQPAGDHTVLPRRRLRDPRAPSAGRVRVRLQRLPRAAHQRLLSPLPRSLLLFSAEGIRRRGGRLARGEHPGPFGIGRVARTRDVRAHEAGPPKRVGRPSLRALARVRGRSGVDREPVRAFGRRVRDPCARAVRVSDSRRVQTELLLGFRGRVRAGSREQGSGYHRARTDRRVRGASRPRARAATVEELGAATVRCRRYRVHRGAAHQARAGPGALAAVSFRVSCVRYRSLPALAPAPTPTREFHRRRRPERRLAGLERAVRLRGGRWVGRAPCPGSRPRDNGDAGDAGLALRRRPPQCVLGDPILKRALHIHSGTGVLGRGWGGARSRDRDGGRPRPVDRTRCHRPPARVGRRLRIRNVGSEPRQHRRRHAPGAIAQPTGDPRCRSWHGDLPARLSAHWQLRPLRAIGPVGAIGLRAEREPLRALGGESGTASARAGRSGALCPHRG